MLLKRCCMEGWSVTYNYRRVQAEAASFTTHKLTDNTNPLMNRCRWAPLPPPAPHPPTAGPKQTSARRNVTGSQNQPILQKPQGSQSLATCSCGNPQTRTHTPQSPRQASNPWVILSSYKKARRIQRLKYEQRTYSVSDLCLWSIIHI